MRLRQRRLLFGDRLEAESSGEVRDVETLLEQGHKREEKIRTQE